MLVRDLALKRDLENIASLFSRSEYVIVYRNDDSGFSDFNINWIKLD